jgi:PAS domain S-box-containing protein
MKTPHFLRLTWVVKSLGSFLGLKRKERQVVTRETWKIDEIKDIADVVETFNSLVAQLCRDGSQLGELYVRAERKAARYALLSETVIDSITSGILVVEATDEITLANSAARSLLGIDMREEIAGKSIRQILEDSTELESLVGENFKTSTNASRRILTVRTRTGRKVCLGASTSCVNSSPSRVDAVIVVFTELGERERAGETQVKPEARETVFPTYLRGVLDCYDHFSSVVREVERIQAKSDKGTLNTSDVTECVATTRRAWEMMTAFALSLVAQESLTELADLPGVIKSVLARRKELAGVRPAQDPFEGLPRVKTVRKVLEAGLELLLLGCVADTSGAVTIGIGLTQEPHGDTVEIKVAEQSPRSQVLPVGDSLREFRLDQDLRREAGLMLLRSLPSENHCVVAGQMGETLAFTIKFIVPIKNETGPTAQRGDACERGPDEI